MTKPNLIDPREMFQDKEEPATQEERFLTPDCGEESYKGNEKLLNRRVLITGGDSGIGRAVAIAFAREGADIALNFLPGEEEEANEVADYIKKAGRKVVLLPYDLKEKESPKALVEKAVEALDGLDTLVLNAGQQISHASITDIPMEQVEDTFKVNILSMFAIAKEAVPHLPPGSSIVTTTSVQGFNPADHLMDYAATKSAIVSFTMSLARQLASKGIRVNGVAPGSVWSALQLGKGQPEGALDDFGKESLFNRAAQPVEMSPIYVLLASNDASFVTGQIYGVTGGELINF